MRSIEGKRVVITRADEQAGELAALLEAAGAVPVRAPTILIAPPASYAELDAALAGVRAHDWLVFTSANGVRSLLGRAEQLGVELRTRVAAVGGTTSRALGERGVPVAFVPPEERASALGATLPDVEARSVLLVRGEKADPALARLLEARGAHVAAVTAYRTLPVAPSGQGLEELRLGTDVITFTSPSTVEGFVSLGPEWRSLARHAIVVTIGPTTTAAALELGFGVHAEAHERSMSALVDAIASVFATVRHADEDLSR
jgi:uroporphyrinogen-III synthase